VALLHHAKGTSFAICDLLHLQGFRSAFLDFIDDPFFVGDDNATRFIADGLLVLNASGHIRCVMPG
jgi:hypothetical protein